MSKSSNTLKWLLAIILFSDIIWIFLDHVGGINMVDGLRLIFTHGGSDTLSYGILYMIIPFALVILSAIITAAGKPGKGKLIAVIIFCVIAAFLHIDYIRTRSRQPGIGLYLMTAVAICGVVIPIIMMALSKKNPNMIEDTNSTAEQ